MALFISSGRHLKPILSDVGETSLTALTPSSRSSQLPPPFETPASNHLQQCTAVSDAPMRPQSASGAKLAYRNAQPAVPYMKTAKLHID